MTRVTQYAIAAAAVLVVAVVGYNLLPGQSSSIGGGATPSPSALAAPSLTTFSPGPSPTNPGGTYRVSNPSVTLYPYSMTVPAGWVDNTADPQGAGRGDAFTGSGVVLTSWNITHVYTDSCHWSGTLAPVSGRSSLVAALTAQVGHDHSAPVETTIGGLPATRIVLTLDKSFDLQTCGVGASIVRLWPDPATVPSGPPDETGGWGLVPGETLTAYVLERDGKTMVLMAVQHVDSPAADVAQLEEILASVRFEVPAASPKATG